MDVYYKHKDLLDIFAKLLTYNPSKRDFYKLVCKTNDMYHNLDYNDYKDYISGRFIKICAKKSLINNLSLVLFFTQDLNDIIN